MTTGIEYVDETWNPVTGCTKISLGCENCYAERMARRLAGRYGYPEAPHHFDVTLHPERLDEPLRRKNPTRYLVCSMGDLFHKDVPDWFLFKTLGMMQTCNNHTFLVLTKRPEHMAKCWGKWLAPYAGHTIGEILPNIWLGVTVETQDQMWRVEELLKIPAAKHWVSIEPMLGPIDLTPYLTCGIAWCIIGSETGPKARPMEEKWVRSLVQQCKTNQVAVFYKQNLVKGKRVALPMLDGSQYAEFPATIDKLSAK